MRLSMNSATVRPVRLAPTGNSDWLDNPNQGQTTWTRCSEQAIRASESQPTSTAMDPNVTPSLSLSMPPQLASQARQRGQLSRQVGLAGTNWSIQFCRHFSNMTTMRAMLRSRCQMQLVSAGVAMYLCRQCSYATVQ
jgi:hypothetical protein